MKLAQARENNSEKDTDEIVFSSHWICPKRKIGKTAEISKLLSTLNKSHFKDL